MKNKKDYGFAFPVFDQKGECLPGGGGFSKHELGALMIAQSMAANSLKSYSFDVIAKDAYILAGKVLDQFK
jgi:hypothetical protein